MRNRCRLSVKWVLNLDTLPSPATHICLYLSLRSWIPYWLYSWLAGCRNRTVLGRQNLPFLTEGSQEPDPWMSPSRAHPFRTVVEPRRSLMPFSLLPAPALLLQVSSCSLLITSLKSFLSLIFPVKHPPSGASGKRCDKLLHVEVSVIDSILRLLVCLCFNWGPFLQLSEEPP